MTGKTKSGITQRTWMFMLEHGGRWTIAELSAEMKGAVTYMDRIVWSMCKTGMVSKYRSGQRKNGTAFGVSARNRIPQGISLGDVLRATATRSAVEAIGQPANDSRAARAA